MNLNKFDEIDSLIRGVEFIVENSEFHELFYYDTPQVRFGKIQIFNEFLSGKILGFFNFFSFGNLNWSYSIFKHVDLSSAYYTCQYSASYGQFLNLLTCFGYKDLSLGLLLRVLRFFDKGAKILTISCRSFDV